MHESILNEVASRIPGWKELSHSNETESGAHASKSEKIVSLLQDTVYDLIADRDAYKAVVEDQMPAEIAARDNQIFELQKIVSELSSARVVNQQESSLLSRIVARLRGN